MKKYIAFTLGPIYQTFQNTRHTREFWAASYIFSYIAKGIILKLIDRKISISEKDIDYEAQIKPKANLFILPNISDAKLFQYNQPVGLFPDHIIVDADILGSLATEATLQEIVDEVIGEFSKEVAKDTNLDENKTKEYLFSYFRIIFRICEVENPILDITPILNYLELQPYFNTKIDKDFLAPFLKHINKKGHFMSNRAIPRFESLIEIATAEFIELPIYKTAKNKHLWNDSDDIDSDGEFVEALIKIVNIKDVNGLKQNKFKTYHKYIAIVKADGDKIGKTLKAISTDKIPEFSKKLLAWGMESQGIIKVFGAKAVYIGGDDLLFMAPINSEKGTVFDLIAQINTAFECQNWQEISDGTAPTLSFGVSITYYKYPLIEALENADRLLYSAKSHGGNAIAIQLLKHSGAELPLTIGQENDLKHFENIKQEMGTVNNSTVDLALINSVGYKLRTNIPALEILEGDSERITHFFENVLEEKIEKNRKPKDDYLKAIRGYLICEYKLQSKKWDQFTEEKKNDASPTQLTVNQLYSMVRIIKFINGFEELKD